MRKLNTSSRNYLNPQSHFDVEISMTLTVQKINISLIPFQISDIKFWLPVSISPRRVNVNFVEAIISYC